MPDLVRAEDDEDQDGECQDVPECQDLFGLSELLNQMVFGLVRVDEEGGYPCGQADDQRADEPTEEDPLEYAGIGRTRCALFLVVHVIVPQQP